MTRLRMFIAVLGATVAIVGTTTIVVSGQASASAPPKDTTLAGSAVPFTSSAKSTGAVAGSLKLTIELWLKPNETAAQGFATAVSTPGNPLFRQYLAPAAYTARFAAPREEAQRVESWLRHEGFAGVKADSGRNYVEATASVSKINSAFNIRLEDYRASAAASALEGYTLHANNRAVSMPTSVAAGVVAVTGLDNAAPILPLDQVVATSIRRYSTGTKSSAADSGANVACS